MKKLLSIFAAVAMLFGLASCSGDLHDSEAPENLYMVGSATPTGWDQANPTEMTKNGTVFTWTGTMTAGEFKFLLYKNWSVQWGSNGKGSNQDAWSITDPGVYTITFDVTTETMTADSLSTALDDPMKTLTIPWAFGGCGAIKLTKNGKVYTGSYTCENGHGAWGEDDGFVRFAILGCIADDAGTAPDVGDSWVNVVSRFGFTDKESGYSSLEESDFVEVGKTVTLKSMPGNGQNIVKGLEAGKTYLIKIDFSGSNPTLTVTVNE